MRTRIALIALLLFLAVMSALILRHNGRARIVAKAVAPNGIEIYLVQRFNWDLGEPFTTGFHYRTPAGRWGWCYYSHQDSYWGAARVQWDEKTKHVTLFRDNKPAVTFDWETETYVLLRRNQTNVGAQTWAPAGTSPDWWTPDLARKP
jgi:hypothetical protein